VSDIYKKLRKPHDMAMFLATGKLPKSPSLPRYPLLDFLETINPSDRARIVGVRLSENLGFISGHTFPTAQALYVWLTQSHDIAETRRIKRFTKRLTIDDLHEAAKDYPKKG